MTLATVTCPACGQTARVPGSATMQATCNAHDQHKHRRGVLMVATADNGEAVNHDKGNT
jgi:hypothetical protein